MLPRDIPLYCGNASAELIDITPTVSVAKLWSANAGKGEGRLGLQQTPVVDGGRVYAAAVEGGVRAFDLQTGKQVWQYKSDLRFSGGPGAGQGLVVVGTLDGQVVALDATTGAEKWQAKVPNEVVAAPAVRAMFPEVTPLRPPAANARA